MFYYAFKAMIKIISRYILFPAALIITPLRMALGFVLRESWPEMKKEVSEILYTFWYPDKI